MKLLGFTIDRHFTGAEHIVATKSKCQGLLGVLKWAAPYLLRELLGLAYSISHQRAPRVLECRTGLVIENST